MLGGDFDKFVTGVMGATEVDATAVADNRGVLAEAAEAGGEGCPEKTLIVVPP